MTKETFNRLVNSVTVRDMAGDSKHYGPGIFVQGMTRDELSQLVTIAGQALGAKGFTRVVDAIDPNLWESPNIDVG